MASELDIRREMEVLRVIKLFHGLDFIVVGGYGIDAYTLHRFSVDLDVVVKKEDVEKFEEILKREGYGLESTRKYLDAVYSGEFKRYAKDVGGPVSVDFLIGSLVSRSTSAAWGFDLLDGNSAKRLVKGLTESVEAKVASREALIAMKLHSGRLTDLRDIVMLLATDKADMEKVHELLARGDMPAVKSIIDKFILDLGSRNFADSLKGAFAISAMGRKPDPSEALIKKSLKFLESVKKGL